METRQPPAGSERKSRSDVPAIWLAASVMRRDEPTRRSRLDTGPYTVDFMNGFSVGWLLACCPAVGVGKQLVGPDTGSTLTRSSEAPAAGAPLFC